jgi:hypothetical protein
MLQFSVSSDSSKILAQISSLKRDRLPRAMMDAANDIGSQINWQLKKEMKLRFDRPTKHTENAIDWMRATRERPEVRIWVKEDPNKGTSQAKYLDAQMRGGGRRHKRFERALIAKGFMPSSMYAVPAYGAPKDQFGNVSGAYIVRMLSDLQALGEQGYRGNRKGERKGKRRYNYWFAIRTTDQVGLRPGIYWSSGATMPALVFAFVRAPMYSVRYPFYEIGRNHYNRYRDRVVARHLQKALYGNR